MVELPDGSIFIAYYEGHQTFGCIRAQFFHIDEDGLRPVRI